MFMKDLFHINSGMTSFVNFKEGAAGQAAGVAGRAKAGTLRNISPRAFNLLTPAKQKLFRLVTGPRPGIRRAKG